MKLYMVLDIQMSSELHACFSAHVHQQSTFLQDPSYDPYGFAKVATRTASKESGSAAACAGNVQLFFQTIFQLGQSSSGLAQINQVNPCLAVHWQVH